MIHLLRALTLAAALLGLLTIVTYVKGEGEGTSEPQATATPRSPAVGAIEMGIDPATTGNSCGPSTSPADGCALGTLEECVRADVADIDIGDATSDFDIDVYVDDPVGIAPAPMVYDAYVNYEMAKVIPKSLNDQAIRMPGSDIGGSEMFPEPTPDGQLVAGRMFLMNVPTPGVNTFIGDGPMARVGLAVQDGANCKASEGGCLTSYSLGTATDFGSIDVGAGGWPAFQMHLVTLKGAKVAINTDCPPPTPGTPTSTPTPGTPTSTPLPTPLPTPPPGTILLVGGWNNPCYVGPEQPTEDALADVADHVLAVYRVRADQGFDRWFPNKPEASTITAVSPYQPLLILMSQYGFWPHEPSGTPSTSVPFASGWNNVCYTGPTKSAEDATAGVAGGFVIMYRFDGGQGWSRYVPDRPEVSTIEQLNQYDTVLMLVSQEGGTTWTFDP